MPACLLLLLAQYLLGKVVNRFVTIPAHHPGANAANYFAGAASGIGWAIPDGPVWLAVHVAFGLALVVASLIAAATSTGNGRGVAITSGLGSLAIIGAAFNGASFLAYAQNFSSMIMASCGPRPSAATQPGCWGYMSRRAKVANYTSTPSGVPR